MYVQNGRYPGFSDSAKVKFSIFYIFHLFLKNSLITGGLFT